MTGPDRILVTGGAGFIGGNLIARLVAAGRDVRVLDDLSSGRADVVAAAGATLIEGSVLDPVVVGRAVAGADAVVHLAAQASVPVSVDDPLTSSATNITGTLAVLDAARRNGGQHVVLASSAAVYGDGPELPKHEGMPTDPRSPYAADKVALEAMSTAFAASYDLPVLPFRFFNVYGPGQRVGHVYAAVVPAFLDAALSGRPLRIFGDGLQTRDFVHVASVVDAIVDGLDRGVRTAAPVNLAFGTRASLLDLVAALEDVLDRPLDRVHEDERPGDVRHSAADQSRFRELFSGLEPIPFRDGLATTADWYSSSAT